MVQFTPLASSTRMALIYSDEEPPSYAGGSASRRASVASPTYSRTPDRTEYVIRSESDAACAALDRYVYSSKSFTVDLGPKVWGTSIPVYGNASTIEGTLTFTEELKYVSAVELKLEGTVTNTYSERGMVAGCTSVEIVSTKLSLSVSSSNPTHTISIPFPTYAIGRSTILPPSAVTYYPGVTCDVKYRLKISLIKKGFRRNESLKLPLLYLPRTFAKAPIIEFIPDIISNEPGSSFIDEPEGLKIVQLTASCKSRNAPAVAVTLPKILSFSSYEIIPMTITIASTTNPAIVKLLQSNVKVHLVKRNRTWVRSARNASSSEVLVGTGVVTKADEERTGITVIDFDLRAQRSAVQKSWMVPEVADQQYFIRVSIRPPGSTADHIPTYDVVIPVEITTDSYDSPERELVVNGGNPTPAIGTLAVGLYSQGHISRQTFSRGSFLS